MKKIPQQIVVGISTSALFDLREARKVHEEKGIEAYIRYMKKNAKKILDPGVGFSLVNKLASFNYIFPNEHPVNIVLMSRNSPLGSERSKNSIRHYGLPITQAIYMSGESPHQYIPAYGVSLFLTANERDARLAINCGYGAGIVLQKNHTPNNNPQLRVAFDFDGVTIDDAAERIFKQNQSVHEFNAYEHKHRNIAHNPGPLYGFIMGLMMLRRLDIARSAADKNYERLTQFAAVTARGIDSQPRFISTMSELNVEFDLASFLGGAEKTPVLEVFGPDLYFDDQVCHLQKLKNIPAVHVPFGIANQV